MPRDFRTRAIVLRRTNYGESDRILNLITPEGKVAALARGVRKEKSRLAGGIELFSIADVVIHEGRSSLGTLTSAQMIKFHSNILTELSRLELASECLKKIDRAAEQVDDPEFFSLLEQALDGLDRHLSTDLIQAWFCLNLARVSGEEPNLACDTAGEDLRPDISYLWDSTDSALFSHPQGNISGSEIKFARFLLTNPLQASARVSNYQQLLDPLEPIIRAYL